MDRPKTIVALGGGGFSMEPENLLLDRYVLDLARRENPAVLFLPTASGDADDYIVKFYTAYHRFRCRPDHLSLFRPSTADLRTLLLSQDIIYVGGGNTKSMLALWREWGLDDLLRQAWESGVVLAGISAGAICWFEQGTTDSIPGPLTPISCLGFLSGSCSPHYDGEPKRRPTYLRMVAEGTLAPGYAADDGVALHYEGTALARIVASRPRAMAYRVEHVEGRAEESPIVPHYLGAQ